MSRAWPVTAIDPDGPVASNARRILAVRAAELFSYAPAVHDPTAVTALHDLRIAAKRVRYTLELFSPIFGKRGKAAHAIVKAFQEDLGNLHDTDVRLALIADQLDSPTSRDATQTASTDHSPSPGLLQPEHLPGLIAFQQRQLELRDQQYQTFLQRWTTDGPRLRTHLVTLSRARQKELLARI